MDKITETETAPETMNIEDTITSEDMAAMVEAAAAEADGSKRQILGLNDKQYYMDSLTENAQKTINALEFIDNDIEDNKKIIHDTQVKIQISQIAKDSLVEKLEQEAVNFEPVK